MAVPPPRELHRHAASNDEVGCEAEAQGDVIFDGIPFPATDLVAGDTHR